MSTVKSCMLYRYYTNQKKMRGKEGIHAPPSAFTETDRNKAISCSLSSEAGKIPVLDLCMCSVNHVLCSRFAHVIRWRHQAQAKLGIRETSEEHMAMVGAACLGWVLLWLPVSSSAWPEKGHCVHKNDAQM